MTAVGYVLLVAGLVMVLWSVAGLIRDGAR